MDIEIDRSKWSYSSQRSHAAHYDERALHYEGIAYHCKKCGQPCVFTAEQQKEAYEVKKRFVWWIPSLCICCTQKRESLKTEVNEYQSAWNNGKNVLCKDRSFLEQWQSLLKEVGEYGNKGSHPSNIVMISKLLNNLE